MAILPVSFLVLYGNTNAYWFPGTYTLIHAFLVKHAHLKAARALKKSVKEFLILKDDAVPEGPALDDIIRSWKPCSQDGDQDE
jgi:hypothetical protein